MYLFILDIETVDDHSNFALIVRCLSFSSCTGHFTYPSDFSLCLEKSYFTVFRERTVTPVSTVNSGDN